MHDKLIKRGWILWTHREQFDCYFMNGIFMTIDGNKIIDVWKTNVFHRT
jgi:hypothetical protein